MKTITCKRCQKEFSYPRTKIYCPDCAPIVSLEKKRIANKRWKQNNPTKVRVSNARLFKKNHIGRPEIVPCKKCGTSVETNGTSRKYCSDCATLVVREQQSQYQREKYKEQAIFRINAPDFVIIECQICKYKVEAKTRKTLYCYHCAINHKKKLRNKRERKRYKSINNSCAICVSCSNPIDPTTRSKYCSVCKVLRHRIATSKYKRKTKVTSTHLALD